MESGGKEWSLWENGDVRGRVMESGVGVESGGACEVRRRG